MKSRTVYDIELSEPVADLSCPEPSVELRKVAAAHEFETRTVQRIREQLESISARYEDVVRQLPVLSLEIVRTVLPQSELAEERVKVFTQKAIDYLNAEQCEVRVHPDCLDTLEGWLADQVEHETLLLADPSLQPGDCSVRAGQIGVEARLADLLEAIQHHLIGSGSPT